MQIRQLQLAYAPEQDRILMRINSSANQEVRCWLTRRMVILLLPNIEKVMQNLLASDRPLNDVGRKALLDMNREVSLYTANYQTPFQEDIKDIPLGTDPLLISQVELKPASEQASKDLILKLATKEGKGFEMRMAEQLQHGFVDLLIKTCEQAKWDLKYRGAPSIIERPDSKHLN
ncbi:MAG: hypothetical protein R3194_04095 [Limnobacter sp.]|nr:hypothetical protein [Limnobacter sp.]